jgi:hypothetical protein
VIPVLIIETVYQPPDAENEEFDYFMEEGEPHVSEVMVTFRELVRMVSDEYRRPSSFPLAVPSAGDWLNADGEQDFRTGELTERSLHLAHNAPARMAKYWAKAWTAGRVRFNFSHPVNP